MAPLLILLLLVPLAPLAGAQDPLPEPENERVYGAQLLSPASSVTIDYLDQAALNLTVEDTSSTDSLEDPTSGTVFLEANVVGEPLGWTASVTQTQIFLQPGTTEEVTLLVQAGATIQEPQVTVRVDGTYIAPNGQRHDLNLTLLAVANPNPIVRMSLEGSVPDFQPDQQQRIPITVRNEDYYPEMISFRVDAPEGWIVSPPSSIQLAPGEERTVYIDVKAPQDPWFRFNPSSNVFLIEAQTDTYGSAQYAIGVPVSIGGAFLPGWVIPHLFLLGIGLLVIGRRTVENAREHRLEKGKPSFPGLPPKKEARFEALKVAAPSKAETMEERLKRLYKKRKEAWKDYYKERKKRARERRRQAKQRHDAVLQKKRKEARRREEAERRKREELEKHRKRKQELLEKKRKLEQRAERERKRQQDELARELREERRRLQSEVSQTGEDAPTDAELQAKRERLEELKRKKRRLEEEEGEPS